MIDIELNTSDIYNILYDCELITMHNKEYGEREVLDEDSIVEDFVPKILDYINSKLYENYKSDKILNIKLG